MNSDWLLEAEIKKKKRRVLILLCLLLVALAAFPLAQLQVDSPAAVAEEQGVGSRVAGSTESDGNGGGTPGALSAVATGTPGDLGTPTPEEQGSKLPDTPSIAVTGGETFVEPGTPAAKEPGSGGTGGTGAGTPGTPVIVATGSGTPGNLSTPAAEQQATPPIVATGSGTPGAASTPEEQAGGGIEEMGSGTPVTPAIVVTGNGTPGAALTPTEQEQATGSEVTPTALGPASPIPSASPSTYPSPSPQPSAPSQLPITGGSSGFGMGWLALGLVGLLLAGGVRALFRRAWHT